jgi:hypothetical protein
MYNYRRFIDNILTHKSGKPKYSGDGGPQISAGRGPAKSEGQGAKGCRAKSGLFTIFHWTFFICHCFGAVSVGKGQRAKGKGRRAKGGEQRSEVRDQCADATLTQTLSHWERGQGEGAKHRSAVSKGVVAELPNHQ